jgi:hypothetical protein
MELLLSKTILGTRLLLFAGLCFLYACKPNIPGQQPVRFSNDFENNIIDTNGFFRNISYSNTGGLSTNYDFGSAWDSLGSKKEKKHFLDSLKMIGFYEETSGVLHEKDIDSFSRMVNELLKGCVLTDDVKASMHKQLIKEYMTQTLFIGGSGCAVRNYKMGNEDEYISFRFLLGTTTVLTWISGGTVTTTTGTSGGGYSTSTSTAMPENVLAGKLAFKGMMIHVKPPDDKSTPPGYRIVNNHRGLEMENVLMRFDTATVVSPDAAILCMKLGSR